MSIIIENIENVNFYGDNIAVATDDKGVSYVSLSQICTYLGLNEEEMTERFLDDPRINLEIVNDSAVVPLVKLNGLLMLIQYNDVTEEYKEDLLRYQVECTEVLSDYWLNGMALNRRETPYDVTSKFKDERAISRPALTKAVASFYRRDKEAQELGLPAELFDKVMQAAYNTCGIEAKHEYEKLTGLEAQYLAWVELAYAKCILKFSLWEDEVVDPVASAEVYVQDLLETTGRNFTTLASSVPTTLY